MPDLRAPSAPVPARPQARGLQRKSPIRLLPACHRYHSGTYYATLPPRSRRHPSASPTTLT